jgi:hypothetical protein
MARQLHKAAKAASDNTVTSMSVMTTYVRRWEAGKITPTERYGCTTAGPWVLRRQNSVPDGTRLCGKAEPSRSATYTKLWAT